MNTRIVIRSGKPYLKQYNEYGSVGSVPLGIIGKIIFRKEIKAAKNI